ncbi:MAG: hypothetical protein AB4368_10155 [Xenococcaceae cyanobacterium]
MSYTFNVPRIITAGDTISWNDNFPELKSTDYTLTHLIRGANTKLDVVGTPAENGWDSTITRDESAWLIPGQHWVQIQVAKPERKITLDTIKIKVEPNFAELDSYDGRSNDEKELEAVSLAIVEISNKGIAEYQIKGRQVRYQDLPDLIRLRDRLRARIARAKNKGKSRNSYISFH